jgi:hypothetical protein
MENAMAYRHAHHLTEYFPEPAVQQMINEMRLYNFFYVTYTFISVDYFEAMANIDTELEANNAKLRILFLHTKGVRAAFYCRFEHTEGDPNAEITSDQLRRHLITAVSLSEASLRVQSLVFPFEISKALLTFFFYGCFKEPIKPIIKH